MFRLISLSLLTLLFLFNINAEANPDRFYPIQKIIDKNRSVHHIPGIQVSVISNGESLPHDFVSGTVDINGKIPLTKKHLFQIGSETKSYTAALLLMLEAKGKLSLDDPIGKWLSSIPETWKTITVRQLLNQSSRLYNYTDSDDFKDALFASHFQKRWSSQELITFAFDKPRCETWCYSNTNFILAGMIIEAVTHHSVEDMMKNILFKPLHLSDTFYTLETDPAILSRMARGYSMKNTFPDEPKDITDLNLTWGRTAGAIISTSHDTAIWLKKLTDGTLLPKKQLQELFTTVPEDEDAFYGLGLENDFNSFQQEIWEHNGGTLGYSSWMIYLKEKNMIVTAIINDATANREDIDSLIKELVEYLIKS